MDIGLKTKKKFNEAQYLCTENSYRYRVILRIAYKEYEKMKFWLYKEDIFELIKQVEGFEEYTIDNLKQDLDSLEAWGNFITIQDTGRAKTLEEFKNRKFRYEISPNTIELERTMIRLESIKENSRGSLEISLIERFKDSLEDIKSIDLSNLKEVYTWWNLLNKDFKSLNENYQDYISKFYSPKAEALLKTTEFLIFKESFIEYLRDFIKGIQINVPYIKTTLRNIEEDMIKDLIKKLVEYEKRSISLDSDFDVREEFDINYGIFQNMKEWFLGKSGGDSLVDNLLDSTNEIIRKITLSALQIIEMQTLGGSRKEEYKTLINMFNRCKDIDEAHKLSSVVFGVQSSRHIVFNEDRETESINSSIFEEKPALFVLKPSNRYREKTASRVSVVDKSVKKREIAKRVLEKRRAESDIIEGRIKDNKLVFKELKNISKDERMVFLKWLSKGLNRKNGGWNKNEFGRFYKVVKNSEEEICVDCIDGKFYMPDYELVFK